MFRFTSIALFLVSAALAQAKPEQLDLQAFPPEHPLHLQVRQAYVREVIRDPGELCVEELTDALLPSVFVHGWPAGVRQAYERIMTAELARDRFASDQLLSSERYTLDDWFSAAHHCYRLGFRDLAIQAFETGLEMAPSDRESEEWMWIAGFEDLRTIRRSLDFMNRGLDPALAASDGSPQTTLLDALLPFVGEPAVSGKIDASLRAQAERLIDDAASPLHAANGLHEHATNAFRLGRREVAAELLEAAVRTIDDEEKVDPTFRRFLKARLQYVRIGVDPDLEH